jgi:diguanylate cyclase (GGDEF)-like protein
MKRLTAYLSQHLLRKIAIRHRLIGSFVLLTLLPLVISGYISYVESTNAIAERTRVFSTEVVKQVSKNIRLEMAKMESESERMVLSPPVQSALSHYAGDDPRQKSAARAELTRLLLERYGSFDFINQKYFLDKDNQIMDTQVFAALGAGVVQFAERAPNLRGRPYWGIYADSAGQASMVLLRAIYTTGDNKLVGSLFLGVLPAHFSSIFDDVDLGSGTDIFVLDARGGQVVVNGPQPAAAGSAPAADPALVEEIKTSSLANQRTGFVGYNAREPGKYLAAYAQIAGTSWYVVSTIPLDKLTAEAQSVRNQSVLIGFLCFVMAIGLAAIIARSISRPLDSLVRSMRETGSGNYASRMTPEGNDELTVLAQKFNEMASTVDRHHVQLEARVRERTRDLAEANSKLAALSLTDGLTGIANRRRFDEALGQELKRAARGRTPLALLMLDVDFFKLYNDFYGHQRGDTCLVSVARLVQSHARRASDLAARYGGEEFAMIAADTDAETALALAETIRASLDALQLPHERSALGRVTASIGVAVVVPDEQHSPEALVRLADQALYRAKEQGRNQAVLAGREVAA